MVVANSPALQSVGFAANAVEVEALPVRAAVIVPAEKFPLESLATIADTVLAEAAVVFALGRTPETSAVRLTAEHVRFPLASIDMALVPAPQSVGLEARAVDVVAFPVNAADIVPALKFPLESLATIADTVLADVAVVFAFGRTPVTSVVRTA